MLFTRTGDDGTSGTFGNGERLPKDSPLFEALGTLDELNSLLGLCYATAQRAPMNDVDLSAVVRSVQQDLFVVQAELAGADKRLSPGRVGEVERLVGELEERFGNPQGFVVAGGSELSALFDLARSVARRAERRVLAAQGVRAVSGETRQYLNRLSSLLYALARFAAHTAGVKEQHPTY